MSESISLISNEGPKNIHEGGSSSSSNGEFIVHTKHTCDNCYRHPIVGQRYTSDVRQNFDLCGKCFTEYTGPDIQLKEAVLIRDKKLSRDFVLKLRINNSGEVQTRRVKVSEIWGKKGSKLQFAKLMKLAAGFVLSENKDEAALAAARCTSKAKATYVDEDGDEISMTTNNELDDAFVHLFVKAKPFIVTVKISQVVEASKSPIMVSAKVRGGMPKRFQIRKVEPAGLCMAAMKVAQAMAPFAETAVPMDNKKPNEGELFIHARHTCDGCQKSPIVGTRYHATKIPDFDLCKSCYEIYEGDELDFNSEVQERDRRMQHRWLNKEKLSGACANIAGMWDKANGDLADFLKQVEESGASIESASVYHANGPKEGETVSEYKSSEKDAANLAEFVKKVDESGSSIGSATVYGPTTEDIIDTSKKVDESANVEAGASSTESHDNSFLSDADGNGSIAEAIGETLDVCVAAIEAAMDAAEEITKSSAHVDTVDVCVAAIEAAMDAAEEITASSAHVETGVVDAPTCVVAVEAPINQEMGIVDDDKEMTKTNTTDDKSRVRLSSKDLIDFNWSFANLSYDQHCELMESQWLYSDEELRAKFQFAAKGRTAELEAKATAEFKVATTKSSTHVETGFVDVPKVEDAVSDGEDDWSVLSDGDGEKVKFSAANTSDSNTKSNPVVGNEVVQCVSQSSASALSPVVLAKWDTELHQLHELGFLDDRNNIDSLEHLEAAHMGVDSTDKVTVNSVVEHLLDLA